MKKNQQDEEAEKIFYENFSKPFLFTRILFKHPCFVILFGVVITIICTIVIIAANSMQMDDIKGEDLLVKSDYRVKRQDSVDVAEETIDELRTKEYIKSSGGDGMPIRTQIVGDHTTIIMYENAEGNVFTEANLKKMFEIENNLITRDNEKIQLFCKAQSETDSSCSDDSRIRITALFKEDMTQAQIDDRLLEIVNNDALYSGYKVLFGEDFTKENPKSKLARSIFKFAMPIEINDKRYKDIYDEFDDQNEEFCKFMYEFYKYVDDLSVDGMSVYLYASNLELYVVMQIALKDGKFILINYFIQVNWIFASFAFILIYIVIHTQSLVFPSIGMLQIIMSLPIAFFLNRYIFCVTYFSMMNLIVLFLILGISADNIFIYVDTWKQSDQIKYINYSLEKRFTFTYKKAIRQITTTTSTTVFNFFMTAITPVFLFLQSIFLQLLPIGSFGSFAVSLVLCNYILVLSFYPSMFIFYAQVMEKRQKKKQNQQQANNEIENVNGNNDSPQKFDKLPITTNGVENNIVNKEECMQLQIQSNGNGNGVENGVEHAKKEQALQANGDQDFIHNENSVNNEANEQNQQQKQLAKPNLIEHFFDKIFSPFLYKARFACIAFFIIWFGISIYFTSQLKAPKEATQAAPDSSNIKKAKERILDFNSAQSDNVIKVDLVWGIKGIDRDAISDRWDSSDRGDVIWDETFDITEPETQQRIYDVCQDLRKNHMNTELIQDNGVNCFMEDFKIFVEAKGYTFPLAKAAFTTVFEDFTETDQGYEFISGHNFGILDGEVKYVKIMCYGTTMLIQQKEKQEPLLKQWEEIIENYNKDSPKTCNKAVQTAGFGWVWMVTEDKLISNTVISLIATGAFAFFVLSCSTLNFLAALYSTLSILGIVICILGLIKMFDWYLGLIETIAASIVVGFSVEYIVFLCIYYLILNFDSRYQKVRQSLTSMGISILGGAITTLGAGVFLVMGEMEFFSKMGKLLIFTIIFSLFWSLIFFSSLLMVCGPMGNTGSIVYIFKQIKAKFGKKE